MESGVAAEAERATGLWLPPEIPSKWDIVPIHNSDRASFKRCRRYFDWTSPARQNLSLRADTHGINTDLWFGTGIHYALENYYQPGLRRDPVESWRTWFNIQWRGGTVTEDWLDKVYDLNPRRVNSATQATDRSDLNLTSDNTGRIGQTDKRQSESALFTVRGLEDIIPDADAEEFDQLYELGEKLMQAYRGYATLHDGFEVLVTEHDFSVPVWDYENNCILKAVDLREQSPNYGKKLEVHSRGRMDGIWQKPSGKLGVIDHKTSSRIDEDFFEKLETDEQVTSYMHAAEVEAKYYNLPYAGEAMEECIYNVLRKAFVKPPTMVRNGLFSVNRNEESTTYELLMAFIEENGIDVQSLDEKHTNYIEYVREVGDDQFFIRKLVRRNRHQLAQAGYRLYLESMDMLDSNLRIYPNLRNDFQCLRCAFRAPCLAKEDGGDWQQLIADNYTRTRDR